MDNQRENEAINAYLKFLQTKGVDAQQLEQRHLFLKKLALGLHGKSLGRTEYATALNLLLKHPQTAEWHTNMSVAREFYPFWMQDIKAIAALRHYYGIDPKSINWAPLPTTLKALSLRLDQERFSEQESILLERYHKLLHAESIPTPQMHTKLRLAKVMLIRLRDAPAVNNLIYRMAVDVTLPLFRWKQSRQVFLEVVREFFQIWMAGPD